MKNTVVLMGPLLPDTMRELDAHYDVHRYWEADDPDALIAAVAHRVEAVVTDGGRGVPTSVLKMLPNCRIVSVFGVGVDAVDRHYCRQSGIAVTNTPDVLSDDVADLAVALALAAARRLVPADRHARQGHWRQQGPLPLTRRMSGKRAGIFGMGSIGARLATRLEGFGMELRYCNRRERSDTAYRFEPTLLGLAEFADFLFITASASSSSQGVVNAAVLDALGADGYLINVARGSLVDEPVLVDYLANQRIAGAGLDVFADEPHIPELLCELDNVVLQPHHASGTTETRAAMGRLMLDNLSAHYRGDALLTPVID